jgi:hypothetical protein
MRATRGHGETATRGLEVRSQTTEDRLNIKSEILSTKHETNPNDQNSNDQNGTD